MSQFEKMAKEVTILKVQLSLEHKANIRNCKIIKKLEAICEAIDKAKIKVEKEFDIYRQGFKDSYMILTARSRAWHKAESKLLPLDIQISKLRIQLAGALEKIKLMEVKC